jgi:hypothetical protein
MQLVLRCHSIWLGSCPLWEFLANSTPRQSHTLWHFLASRVPRYILCFSIFCAVMGRIFAEINIWQRLICKNIYTQTHKFGDLGLRLHGDAAMLMKPQMVHLELNRVDCVEGRAPCIGCAGIREEVRKTNHFTPISLPRSTWNGAHLSAQLRLTIASVRHQSISYRLVNHWLPLHVTCRTHPQFAADYIG